MPDFSKPIHDFEPEPGFDWVTYTFMTRKDLEHSQQLAETIENEFIHQLLGIPPHETEFDDYKYKFSVSKGYVHVMVIYDDREPEYKLTKLLEEVADDWQYAEICLAYSRQGRGDVAVFSSDHYTNELAFDGLYIGQEKRWGWDAHWRSDELYGVNSIFTIPDLVSYGHSFPVLTLEDQPQSFDVVEEGRKLTNELEK